ncbi:Transcription factor Sp5 [Operophtera brumata]|uniref:Transcription factor Sp5 n=1 Tax=Operophtera brumata TaxID=104452 RepID=A0A0L7LKL1_OPEBR|nr:Transcription factor Sp5 [Operophtera brumata]
MEVSQEDETQYIIRDESDIPVPVRVFVCKWCAKPFKRKDHYKIHLHIHTGVKVLPQRPPSETHASAHRQAQGEETPPCPPLSRHVVMSMDNGERRAVTYEPHEIIT